MTAMFNDRIDNLRDFLVQIMKVEDDMVKIIRKSQKDLIIKCMTELIDEGAKEIIDDIYSKKDADALSGQEAYDICEELQDDWICSYERKM